MHEPPSRGYGDLLWVAKELRASQRRSGGRKFAFGSARAVSLIVRVTRSVIYARCGVQQFTCELEIVGCEGSKRGVSCNFELICV